MKKKVLAVLLSTAMAATVFTGCGSKSSEDKNITIWVADDTVDFTKEQAEKFISDNSLDYTITVEAVGEGAAASNMITDVQGGADIYGFAQDQIARLVSAGALQPLSSDYSSWVSESNDAGAVNNAMVGDTIYAFPMTSDNGYYLYYDKSVVTNPDSLEDIIADCEAAGKNFYFQFSSGWYQAAFFFGTGCTVTYDTDNDGNFTACNIDYASDAGVVALQEMIELASSSSYQDGSSVDNANNIGAIVDGTWDANAAKEALGDNYACAKLPSFVGSDGKTYQLGSFGGAKLIGVKPQTDENKLAVCYQLAQYLTSSDVQLGRFSEFGWGPSNKAAQSDPDVQANEALAAVAAQSEFSIPQGNYPDGYWTDCEAFGADVAAGNYASASDDELLTALQSLQDSLTSYASN